MQINIDDYKKYMLTNENLTRIRNIDLSFTGNSSMDKKAKSEEFKSEEFKERKSKRSEKVGNNFLFDDTLFSCMINILNLNFDYELENRFKIEKDFKINAIAKLREIKHKLKAMKLKLNCIENELLNEKKIGLKTLIALCLLYNKNLMYICKNKYFEIINDGESKMNIIIKDNNNFELLENYEGDKMQYYRENYFQIENIEKPLKAVSGYTKDELKTIYEKLQIKDANIKFNKKEIYQKISENINFFF